jgi:hypothetical protein
MRHFSQHSVAVYAHGKQVRTPNNGNLRRSARNRARSKSAAPYVHPKLASIQHGNDPDNPLDEVTDADRAAVVLAYIAENPKLLDQIRKQFH